MRHFILCLLIVTIAASVNPLRAGDVEKAEEKLAKARDVYADAMSAIRDDVLKQIDDKDKAERGRRAKADLDKLGMLKTERNLLENEGTIPKWIDSKTNLRIKKALEPLIDALKALRTAYVGAKEDEKARAIDEEIEQANKGIVRKNAAIGSVLFNGSKYKVFPESVTWHQAKKRCEQKGGQLVAIDSAEENKVVAELAQKAKLDVVWIGANDEAKEGQWVWTNDKRLTYSNWLRDQPNNFKGEHFAQMVVKAGQMLNNLSGQWNDMPDVDQPGFVCEWDDRP